jgi:hypothetical protein
LGGAKGKWKYAENKEMMKEQKKIKQIKFGHVGGGIHADGQFR